MNHFLTYLNKNEAQAIAELRRYCAQPSVSATGEGIGEMAAIVRADLEALGATVQMLEVGPGEPPVVYGTLGEGDKTLLIYNHYDVQPVEPLELWDSSPYELTERAGKLYARGASDNKGHLVQRMQAIRAWQETVGPLPFKINWFIEGEEEIGSPNLEPFCEAHVDLLRADGCLWEMGNHDEAGRPILSLGAKGLLYVELSVRSSKGDQHSAFGTLVPNAAWRLTWALSTLKAADETILIDGLMDYVAPPDETDLALLRAIPFDETAMQQTFGIDGWVGGLSGPAALKRHFFGPTCTICGMESGYTGQGQKTVLPATARAKVGFRLVPNLTPHITVDLLRRHLDKHGFEDVRIDRWGGEHPGKSDPNAPIVRAAIAAAHQTYPDQEPVIYPLAPGTGPVWPVAIAHGTPLVSFGSSYARANLHAPNENIRRDDYLRGIEMMGHFIAEFATR